MLALIIYLYVINTGLYIICQMENSYSYWCYNCEKNFQTNHEANACIHCSGTAFQTTNQSISNNQPSAFQVYQLPPQPTTQLPNIQTFHTNNVFPGGFAQATFQFGSPNNMQSYNIPLPPINSILSTLSQSLFSPQGGLFNLINSLVGQRNLIPATPAQINRLQKIDIVSGCTICLDDNIENQQQKKGYKLKCGHMFHFHCIGPWFERTNTCPTCRVKI